MQSSIMLFLNQNISEIRCPSCFFYISIELNNNNILYYCENCGNKEMPLNEFNEIIKKNNIKSCNSCCKNNEIKEMLYSKKYQSFLCKKCFIELKDKNEINSEEYINVNELGKYCLKHKGKINQFFCTDCNIHICEECKRDHKSHDIKSIKTEVKYQKKIDEMNDMLIKEEKSLEEEKNIYEKLLSNMSKKFEKEIKNRTDILKLKKIIFDCFSTNYQNYSAYQNIINVVDDKKISETKIDLDSIDKLINNISLNNEINNNNSINNLEEENRSNSKYSSFSVIKQSKKKAINNLSLEDNKSNIYLNKSNINNKRVCTLDKSIFGLATPVKLNSFGKNKRQEYKNSINIINQEMLNKNVETIPSNMSLNDNNSKENNQILTKLSNSIINMIYLEKNRILVSIFSQGNNLLLIQIKQENNINDNKPLSLDILEYYNIHQKQINHIEMGDDEYILSCSDNKLVKFKIKNNKIIYDFTNFLENDNSYITCFSFEKQNILALNNQNINYYKKHENGVYTKIFLPKINGFRPFYMEKLSNNYILLIGQNDNLNDSFSETNKDKIYLKFFQFKKNELIKCFEKEFMVNQKEKEKEKIFAKEIFENYAIVSLPNNGFIILDYLKNKTLYEYPCEYIISMKIDKFNEDNVFCYTVETKENEGKNIEEMFLKKYLIQKSMFKRNKIEFSVSEKSNINLPHENRINDIVLINDNNNIKDQNKKTLVLLGDNEGNILYNYC